jgi:hypothetical protein
VFLVQVRHGGDTRWITIGAFADRAAAAHGGSTALVSPEEGGHGAAQVRVVTDDQLARQGSDVVSGRQGTATQPPDPAA